MSFPVMVGTRFDTMGGISSVVNVYRTAGFFERMKVRYLASHCDGGAAKKLWVMVSSLAQFFLFLCLRKVSVVHVHMSSRASFWRKSIFLLLAGAFRVPRIIHLHGSEFAIFYEKECSSLARNFVRFVFDSAESVVVLSQTWKEWVSSVSRNQNVVCVYNPVLVPESDPVAVEANSSILFMGRLGRRKGTYDLVRAVAKINQPFRLVLAGDGDLEEVRELVDELGISDKVEVTGWVRGDQKEALLKRACLYVLPSYNEGLPMGILEAMAQGLPIVSTPIGGIPEAVDQGVEGFLTQPGDVDALARALEELMSNSELRRQIGAAARARIRSTFSADHVLPQLERIYVELVGHQ